MCQSSMFIGQVLLNFRNSFLRRRRPVKRQGFQASRRGLEVTSFLVVHFLGTHQSYKALELESRSASGMSLMAWLNRVGIGVRLACLFLARKTLRNLWQEIGILA